MANMSLHVLCLAVVLMSHILLSNSIPGVHKKFEYKLSFKGPHLVQRDGTVPFWEHGGHAIASDESIRITPSLRSKKGWVWSKNKSTLENWEIEVTFRVSGRGRIGADGLALWFTSERGTDGPVFGSNDKWNGLGIFMDSFDNDGQHNNPYVMVMVNDGTKSYDHNTDGSSQQLGGCLRDYRNKPFPVRARIEYYQKALTVFFHTGMTNNRDDFELCMRAENVELPKEGHFGISAATGGLADDHDVSSFLTHSLSSASTPGQEVPEDERKKFEQEFDDYHKKLQQAKDDYQKEHPDQRPADDDDEQYFESQDSRELKNIFEGQNAIHNTMRLLHQRLDEVIGRQERTLSQIAMIQQGAPSQGHQGGPPQPPAQGQLPYVDTIKRHEVDTVLNTQRELQNSMRDLRSVVGDVQNKINALNSQGGGARSGYDGTQHYSDLKSSVNSLHSDVKNLVNRPSSNTVCPTVEAPSCVTTFYLFLFFVMQIIVFFVYMAYRSSREAAAKKFY